MMHEYFAILIEFVMYGALLGVAFLAGSTVVALGVVIAEVIKKLFVKLRRAIRFNRAKKQLKEGMKERQDIHAL